MDQEVQSIEKIIENVNKKREWLHSQHIDDLLEFFEKLGKYWAENFSKEIGVNSKHLISFLSKENLGKKLDISLRGDRSVLEKFVDLSDPEFLKRIQASKSKNISYFMEKVPTASNDKYYGLLTILKITWPALLSSFVRMTIKNVYRNIKKLVNG